MYFTNEIDFNKLSDLILHCLGSLEGELSPSLPHRLAARGDIEPVDYFLRGDSWHISDGPCKDV